MCKTFFVAPGHEAVNRGVWHPPGLLVSIEEGETVSVYAINGSAPKILLATYAYDQLDADDPPTGLFRDHRHDPPARGWSGHPEPVRA